MEAHSPLYSSPLKTADGRYLPTVGGDVCNWIETHCVYGEGDWFGQPVRLREWQRSFVYRLYEFFPETGRRRYRRALFGIAKGNGKSPIASWIAAYELFGQETKEFPRVLIGAASLKQANLVFGDLRTTTENSPTLAPRADCFDREIQVKGEPGIAERIAAEAGTNDGARATCFIADELHEWQGQRERVHLVVEGAVVKRENAFSLSITTAGIKSIGVEEDWDLLNRLYAHGKRVAKGEIVDDSFLFEWYEAAADLDLDNPADLELAIRQANPAAGDFNDLENLRYLARTMPRHEFRRYRLNQFVEETVNHAIPLDRWDACAGSPALERHAPVWVGVDTALSQDSTAVSVVGIGQNNRLCAKTTIYPADKELGTDYDRLEQAIRDIAATYEVQEVAYDPFAFARSAAMLADEGLPMLNVRQDDTNMIPASQALYDVVTSGLLEHEGDPRVRAHVEAAVAVQKDRGWRLSKKKSRAPIDAAIALAIACWRATLEQETEAEARVSVL